MLVSYFTYFSTLKKEATCSSEASVDFQQTTQRYITEGRTLHNRRRKILIFPCFIMLNGIRSYSIAQNVINNETWWRKTRRIDTADWGVRWWPVTGFRVLSSALGQPTINCKFSFTIFYFTPLSIFQNICRRVT
jgi:hypothetical protein